MAIEVANLLARIEVQLRGATQAAAELQRFTAELRNAGAAAEATGFERAADKITALSGVVSQQRGEVAQLDAQWKQFNTTVGQAQQVLQSALAPLQAVAEQTGQSLEQVTIKALELQGVVSQYDPSSFAEGSANLENLAKSYGLTAEQAQALLSINVQEVAQARAAISAYEERNRAILKLIGSEERLARTIDSSQRAARETVTAMTASAAGVGTVTNATNRYGRAASRASRQSRGFLRSLLAINNGSILTASGIASLIGRMTGFGAVAIGAVVVIRKILAAFDQLARVQAFTPLSSQMKALAADVGVVESELQGLVGASENFFRSIGAVNADVFAENIARLAAENEALFGSFAEAYQAFSRAIQQGDFSGLAEAGFQVQYITESLKAQGIAWSDAEAAAQRYGAVASASAREAGRAAEASSRQITSWSDVQERFRALLDKIAQAFAPILDDIFTGLEAFVDLLAAAMPLIRMFTGFLRTLADIMEWVGLAAKKSAGFLADVFDAAASIARQIPEPIRRIIGLGNDWAEALEGVADNFRALEGEAGSALRSIEAQIDPVIQRIQELENLMTQRSLGFGLLDQIEQLGAAYNELQEGPSVQGVLDYAKAYDRVFQTIIEQGPVVAQQQLELTRALFTQLAGIGDIPRDEYEKMMGVLDNAQIVVKNMGEKYEELTGTQMGAKEAAQNLSGGLNNVENAALGAAGGVDQLNTNLRNLPDNVTVPVNVQVGLSGNSLALKLIGGFILRSVNLPSGLLGDVAANKQGPAQGPPTPSTLGSSRAATESARLRGGGAALRGDRAAAASSSRYAGMADYYARTGRVPNTVPTSGVPDITSIGTGAAAGAVSSGIRGGASGGGGGGGGGGGSARDERLATIEEIKKFFEQVNKAILAGIRGGVAFSTAGNAIPLGGPGQFVGSQGGVLIEQVNLRGVWDFADPAAKREIVRQLKEALAYFDKEVA